MLLEVQSQVCTTESNAEQHTRPTSALWADQSPQGQSEAAKGKSDSVRNDMQNYEAHLTDLEQYHEVGGRSASTSAGFAGPPPPPWALATQPLCNRISRGGRRVAGLMQSSRPPWPSSPHPEGGGRDGGSVTAYLFVCPTSSGSHGGAPTGP